MTGTGTRGRHRAAGSPARPIAAVGPAARPRPATGNQRKAIALFAAAALVAGAAATVFGAVTALVVAGVALFVMAALRPVTAVYVYMATLPFLAGIDRSTLLPLVRPNEAVLALLVAGAACGTYGRYLRGDHLPARLRPLDIPLAVFVLLSTLWPIAWLLLRGIPPTGADWAALLPVCKLTGLLVLVRTTIRTDEQLVRLGRVIAWPAAAIAVLAVLQTLKFSPVVSMLNTYWSYQTDPSQVTSRGTTTFASSIATGDYVMLALALVLALGIRGLIGRREMLVLGSLLVAGILAAGQFSTWASALVVGVTMLYQYRELRRLALRFWPVFAVAAVVGSPALISRLSEFGGSFGVPRSWLGRWDNLVTFYLPGIGHWRWVLGVGPNSVLPAPETWRSVIYLEYGYLQFLWVGGLPLLAAFFWLSFQVLRHARALARRPDAVGAYASALWSGWWMVLVLSVIDIHLVLRGAGELLFIGLAVVSGRADET